MKAKEKELKDSRDLIIKIVLVIIIILLLLHNCSLMREKNKYQNNVPSGNVDIIDIKCDNNQCKNKEIESLSFSSKSVTILKGDSLNLVVLVKPSELASTKFTWKSSDTKVVTVDANGRIKGIGLGTATITVTSANGKKATITVNVTNESIPVEEIKLSPSSATIKAGSTTQISAGIKPDNATNRELVWSSSDPSIASVDSKGVVKGIKAGTVTITARTKDGKVVASSTITVEEVAPTPTPMVITSLSFTEDNITIKKGNSLGLIVEIEPIELSSTKLTWRSSDSSIVSVDSNGKITGLKKGTVTITVSTNDGKSATCTVTVTDDTVLVESITLSPNKVEVGVGGSKQVIATIEPSNATNREIVWTSSDSNIAVVDSNGIVTGIKVGTVNITASTTDSSVVAVIICEVDNDDDSDTFKVYDKEKPPVNWNGATDLKIFTKSIYNIDGVIAPESSNTYEFDVKNSTDYNIKYDINFIESNTYNINMKYKLRKNNTYIIDHYVSASELNITGQLLNVGNKDVYYLEWKWISSSNDTSIGTNPQASYGLQILVEAESVNE